MIQASDRPRVANPRITAVIAVKGGAPMLRDCLDALAAQDLDEPYEVIVVDGWWDDAVAAVVESYPFTCLVRSDENLLQGRARNIGAQHARSAYLAITDADCRPEPGWLRAAVRALDEGVRLAGGPVLDALPDNLVAISDNFSQFAEMSPGRPEGPQDHFPGCNMAMRTADLFDAGGFPHTGMPGGEDTFLCFAIARRHGAAALRFRPDMRVRHRGREDLKTFLKHQRFFGYCRASMGIKLTPGRRRLGRSWAVAPLVVALRLKYMVGCVVRWSPQTLPKVARMLPLVVLGLAYWAAGFREGCRQAMTLPAPAVDAEPGANAATKQGAAAAAGGEVGAGSGGLVNA